MLKFDVVSDLHIDQWDLNIKNKYPCGHKKHFPLQWKETDSKILVVAGDVSDDINVSIEYLNQISEHYDKILFVDGNHEHVVIYPELYTTEEIDAKITNDKIVYLPENDYVHDRTVVIGYCGWWDYDGMKNIEDHKDYFDKWIPSLTPDQTHKFADNVVEKSNLEYYYLHDKLESYSKSDKIDNIIIVTHTLPRSVFAEQTSTEFNSQFDKLFQYPKLKKWIFGHTHSQNDQIYKDVHLFSNPRGRPEDYDREQYFVKSQKC